EATKADAALAEHVAEQQLGDEVARQYEEDVDADEAAREAHDAGVEQHDEIHRDRAEAVEMGAVVRVGWSGCVAGPGRRCRGRRGRGHGPNRVVARSGGTGGL